MSRRVYGLIACVGVALAVIGAVIDQTPRLIWNASASAPIGLYAVDLDASPRIGDLVSVAPSPELRRLLAERGYLPSDALLLKYVAALAGQTVCRHGADIMIDGAWAGRARVRDSQGRPLPAWRGCVRLKPGHLFLLNPAPDSFDGRYVGPLPAHAVRGCLISVFTDPHGDGRFVWRASAVRTPASKPQEGHDP